jgi:hypothetical protein
MTFLILHSRSWSINYPPTTESKVTLRRSQDATSGPRPYFPFRFVLTIYSVKAMRMKYHQVRLISKISAFIHTMYLDIPYCFYTQYLLFPRTALTDFLKWKHAQFGMRHLLTILYVTWIYNRLQQVFICRVTKVIKKRQEMCPEEKWC